MTFKNIQRLFNLINLVPESEQDELSNILLSVLKNPYVEGEPPEMLISNTALKAQNPPKQDAVKKRIKKFKFTKEELDSMPKPLRLYFIHDNKIVRYRFHNGLFHTRFQKDGVKIELASKNLETLKIKFINALNEKFSNCPEYEMPTIKRRPTSITFGEYGKQWLDIKEKTTKPTTYKEYERLFRTNLDAQFGELPLDEITRSMVLTYLFSFVEQGKMRTAQKLKLQLDCIFDMAVDDFNIPSPMKRIVLPHYEAKKGSAFTKQEEAQLVEYCKTNGHRATTSALLVLLYFGLRKSELSSLRVIDNMYLECEQSKERMGRNVVIRKIPFTPMAKKLLPYIDFEKAKNTNVNTIGVAVKRLFPNHHPHELRYTYITRCKECGVNPEVVMLWDGHEADKDVKASRVDRGYTDFSEEYILKEAEKVDYELN